MDYSNSLYFGIDNRALARLQKVQNAAARMRKSVKKFESVTPLSKSLKWMPVRYRISYKILLLVFKALHNFAPSYLSSVLAFYNPSRSLRSENLNLLCVVGTKYKQKGNRAFSCVRPKLWNDLLLSVRSVKTLPKFKAMLKAHLLKTFWVSSWWC